MPPQGETVPAIIHRASGLLLPLGLSSGGLLAFAFGTWVFLYLPAVERLNRAQAAYEAARRSESRLQAARAAEEQLERVRSRLPLREHLAALGVTLAEIAAEEHVRVPGMTYALEEAPTTGLPSKATVSFKAEGRYDAIRRFVHRLETHDVYHVIESLSAARRPGRARLASDGNSATVLINVQVVTFLRRDHAQEEGAR